MKRDRTLAGIGGIVFSVFLIVGFFVAGPPGGEYHADDVADFVSHGHRTSVIASVFLVAVSVVGLLAATAYICDTYFGTGRHGRLAWGTALIGAAAFLIGWAVTLTPATSLTIGGGPSLDPAVSYTIMQAGFGILFVVGGIFLGISFLTLALAGRDAPTWVRIFNAIVGLLALFSLAFFPFYAVLLWGLVIGIWLLASAPPATAATPQNA